MQGEKDRIKSLSINKKYLNNIKDQNELIINKKSADINNKINSKTINEVNNLSESNELIKFKKKQKTVIKLKD